MSRMLVELNGDRRIVDGVDYRQSLRPAGWKVVGVEQDPKSPMIGKNPVDASQVDGLALRQDAQDEFVRQSSGPALEDEILTGEDLEAADPTPPAPLALPAAEPVEAVAEVPPPAPAKRGRPKKAV